MNSSISLDFTAAKLHNQLAPENAGTEHLEAAWVRMRSQQNEDCAASAAKLIYID